MTVYSIVCCNFIEIDTISHTHQLDVGREAVDSAQSTHIPLLTNLM